MKRLSLLIPLVALTLLGAGCSSGETTQKTNTTTSSTTTEDVIAIESKAFSFTPKTINAKVGEKVMIDVTANEDHNFTIDELSVAVDTPSGKTTRVEFTPTTAGTFTFYCSLPGHKAAGQFGTLVVE
ncbi:MAG: cupredoxin domain-containing protein [Candidatus Kerfeldbacteria bacterium]|nr:cupredoxin domain-containing protein [Candidatus Kerfeldbacteria bacterium]